MVRRAVARILSGVAAGADRLGDSHLGVYDRRSPATMFTARTVSALLAFMAFIFLISISSSPLKAPDLSTSAQSVSDATSNTVTIVEPDVLNGTHVTLPDGSKFVYQAADTPRGVIMFFHGCKHAAKDYFPAGQGCADCVGLPEELRMVRLALSRKFTAVAISSTGGLAATASTKPAEKCWMTNVDNASGPDYDRVKSTLDYLKEHQLYNDDIPLFAVGTSSGGRFATSLAPRFPIAALNTMISPSALSSRSGSSSGLAPPPHAFTHMKVRDSGTAGAVEKDMSFLQQQGVPVVQFTIAPHPVTADWLLKSLPNWDDKLAQDVVSALASKNVIGSDGHVVKDPRRSDWRSAVTHLKTRMHDSLENNLSPLEELLYRAYAQHEITSDHFSDVLDFFQTHGKITN